MKKILIILLAISAFSCKAQQIIPMEEEINYRKNQIEYPSNVYLKDVNGLLDKYVGIWKKTQSNRTYEFRIVKITRESNDQYMQFKKDKLEMRYKITNATTGDVIVNTTTLNDGPLVIKGKHFSANKLVYSLNYIGLNYSCGQNGTVFIQVSQNNLNDMHLFLYAHGETIDCPTGQVPQVLPTDKIVLDKQ